MIPDVSAQEAPGASSSRALLSSRFFSIDVLRGIAVLSALFVSIWIFGGFSEMQQKELLARSRGWNYRVFGAVELLLNGKMRALIALVFGAAMVIFLSRETEPGRQPSGDVFIKRQMWLILFGLFNAVILLWSNDLLFHLGILGILLFPFFRMHPRSLLIAALLTTAIYCGKYYWNYADDQKAYSKYVAVTKLEKKYEQDSVAKSKTGVAVKKDTLTKQQQNDKQAWTGILASKKIDTKGDEKNRKAMRSGSYTKVWNHLLPSTQSREAQWTYQFGVWDLAALIFLGMLLYKIGFFDHRYSVPRYALIALVAIGGGLLLGWYRLHFQQIGLQDYEKFIQQHALPHHFFFPVERAAMAVGYAALVMAVLNLSFLGSILRALAAAGKMALTNYLLQTLICTIFFYGYGMGYFGRLTQFQLYLFAAEVILMQVVFSVLWLRIYNYGPAEWLIRRISAGKWLPLKFKKADEQTIPVLS